MVSCPVFLRLKGPLLKKEGATLTEILISVTVIAILAVLLLYAFQPQTQIIRSQDAKRKADVTKLQNILEDYYNDHDCYPNDLNDLVPYYITPLPRDPKTGALYDYYSDPEDCDIYRIYVVLGYTEDPDIIRAGCEAGCGPGGDEGSCEFNYGVSSTNCRLEECTPAVCALTGCSAGNCNSVTEDFVGTKYCNDPCCEGNCCGPEGCPWECGKPGP